MKIAVLALQGAYREHEEMLAGLGAEVSELRKREDALQEFDGLVLPGGESTVQGMLLKKLSMFDILKEKIENGLPVLATCAGLILLAETISNDCQTYFQTLPVTVKRNAYGRQSSSFFYQGKIKDIGSFPMEFIRAPYIEEASKQVEVLARAEQKIVAVRYQNQFAFAFHPELTQDRRLHASFLDCCAHPL